MSNGNALKASELAKILQEKLSSEWNVIAGDDCARELANACFDYIGLKVEAQLQKHGCLETIRD